MSLESCLSWNWLFLPLAIAAALCGGIDSAAQTPQVSTQRDGFQQPPASDRLCYYRRWLAGYTNEQTITCDLETWIRICCAGSFSPDRCREIAKPNQITCVEV